MFSKQANNKNDYEVYFNDYEVYFIGHVLNSD